MFGVDHEGQNHSPPPAFFFFHGGYGNWNNILCHVTEIFLCPTFQKEQFTNKNLPPCSANDARMFLDDNSLQDGL